jgi:hypothetical protein
MVSAAKLRGIADVEKRVRNPMAMSQAARRGGDQRSDF